MGLRRPYLRRLLAWVVDGLFLSVLIYVCVLWFQNELTQDPEYSAEIKRLWGTSQSSEINSLIWSLKEIPVFQYDRFGQSFEKTLAAIHEHFEKEQGGQIHLRNLLQLPDLFWLGIKGVLEVAGFEMDNDLYTILIRRYAQVRLYKVRLNMENLEKKKISESFLVQIKRFLIFIVALTPLYFVLEVLIGRSIGKLLTGLVIVRQTKFHNYEEAKFFNLFVRWLIKCSEWLIFGIGLQLDLTEMLVFTHYVSLAINLGLLFVFGKSFQTLYDKLSGTGVVVKKLFDAEKSD